MDKKKLIVLISEDGVQPFKNLIKYKNNTILVEPEKGLHPIYHISIAEDIMVKIESGKYIILFTNSDFIIKELNIYIISQRLNFKEVEGKEFYNGKIVDLEINKDQGIISQSFDIVIDSLNQRTDEIYYK
jgi:predicted ATPase